MFLFYDSFECKFMFTRNVLHIRKIYDFVLCYYLILFSFCNGKIMDQEIFYFVISYHSSCDANPRQAYFLLYLKVYYLSSLKFYYQFLPFITHLRRKNFNLFIRRFTVITHFIFSSEKNFLRVLCREAILTVKVVHFLGC